MPDLDTPDDDAARLAWANAKVDRIQIEARAACTFLPGSWDKSFVRRVADLLAAGEPLSDGQRCQVLRLTWKYRRQLPQTVRPAINPADPLSPHFQGWRSVPAPAQSHRARLGLEALDG